MASVSNPDGVSCEEYSQFALHAIKYLSYLKDYPAPALDELTDLGKMVDFTPTQPGRKLVVFDLDETLVHCIFNDPDIHDADVFLDIKMPNGRTANTGFNIRPYWRELMDGIKKHWDVVVFTASCKNYADAILDYMDPDNEYFERRLYRETCYKTEDGVYIKDLRVFKEWALEDVILVDNAVYSFGFQLDNGIPIFPYIQGKDDKQLLHLKDYLQFLEEAPSIKDIAKTFRMSSL